MASLRKKPTDATVAAPDPDASVVAVSVESDAPKASIPEPPSPDSASSALKRQIELLNQAKTMGQQAAIAELAANERRQAWLASTPGAKANIHALGAFHKAALDSGLADTSPSYFSFLEQRLAELQQPAAAATHLANEMQMRATQDRAPPPAEPKRSPVYSAPVSRDVPSARTGRRDGGRVTLTPAEQEMALVSGVSLEEYAKQKLKLAQMKASGEYGEDRGR